MENFISYSTGLDLSVTMFRFARRWKRERKMMKG
jgi:hypothetical protein